MKRRLTFAPLATPNDIFRALRSSLLSNNNSALRLDLWESKKLSPHLFFRGAWAMCFLFERLLRNSKKITVLVPSYFCGSTLAVFRNISVNIVYYPLTESLTPNWEWIERNHSNSESDVFVLVHYFGFQSDVEGARNYCDKNGVVFLEDASHVLRPFGEIGECSDAVFYSLHKTLALPYGSVLATGGNFGELRELDVDNFHRGLFLHVGYGFFETVRWVIKKIVQYSFIRLGVGLPEPAIIEGSSAVDDDLQVDTLPIYSNLFTNKLLNIYSERLDGYAQLRRENFTRIYALLRESRFSDYVSALPGFSDSSTSIPYALPVKVCREAIDEIYGCMTKLGMPVWFWPDLPAGVDFLDETFKDSLELRRTLLFFPVHQSLNMDVVEEIFSSLENVEY